MRQQGTSLDFEAVCKYVGQLYLESRHEIQVALDQARGAEDELRRRLEAAQRERDEAVAALARAGKAA